MKSIRKVVKSVLLAGIGTAFLMGAVGANASVLGIKVDGLYCNLCIGGTLTQLKSAPGVQSVKLWQGSGMIWVAPASANLARIKTIIVNSTYPFKGAWVCAAPTTNLASCKQVN